MKNKKNLKIKSDLTKISAGFKNNENFIKEKKEQSSRVKIENLEFEEKIKPLRIF